MPAHAPSYFEHSVMAPGFERLGWKAHTRPNAINSKPYQKRSQCLACRACTACPSGARYSADLVHARDLVEQPTGTLMTGLKLRRLEIAKDGKRVIAAHCVRLRDRSEVVIEGETIVLALNAIETPRMLLLSADARHHPAGLGNGGGQLGRDFSDHIMTFFWFELDQPVGRGLAFPSMNCEHFRDKVGRDRRGTFSINFLPMPSEIDWVPPQMMQDLAVSGERLTLSDLRRGLRRSVIGYAIHELSGNGGVLALDGKRNDGFGDPVANVKLVPTDWDRAGPEQLQHLQGEIAGALGARRHWDGWSRGEFGFAAHPSGATAMGASPDVAVCDRNARVFGLDNLYVASSSLFPHQGAANPTLTIVALALRLANHLTGAPVVKRLPSRRAILKSAAAIGALAATPGCRRRSAAQHDQRALRDDLWHLVLVIGPWPAAAKDQADALIPRYLSAERMKRFEPDTASFAQLAARFANHEPAAESIELAGLSKAERSALVALTADLYSVMQVRFAVTGTPAPGQCMADPLWHTQVPQK